MSEDKVPYGDEAEQWERDAQELRALMDSAGLTQIAAGRELDVAERTMRGYCSGREPVPRAILFAMRWLVEHKPNNERWLQVHWRKAGISVKKGDEFRPPYEVAGELVFEVNGEVKIHGKLQHLLRDGIVSVFTSYSSDRFRWPEAAPGPIHSAQSLAAESAAGHLERPTRHSAMSVAVNGPGPKRAPHSARSVGEATGVKNFTCPRCDRTRVYDIVSPAEPIFCQCGEMLAGRARTEATFQTEVERDVPRR